MYNSDTVLTKLFRIKKFGRQFQTSPTTYVMVTWLGVCSVGAYPAVVWVQHQAEDIENTSLATWRSLVTSRWMDCSLCTYHIL